MAINLKKGDKIDLTKGNPGLNKIVVGLGWDAQVKRGGSEYDLDATVFMLDKAGVLKKDSNMVYYGNLKAKGVQHTGDNLTGEGEGDDEVINVDLSAIPSDVDKLMFVVNIYNAKRKKQSFGEVKNSYIRVVNPANRTELIRFDLKDDFSNETGLIVAEIYRENSEWKFNAIGNSFRGELSSLKSNLKKGRTCDNTPTPPSNNAGEDNEPKKKGLFGKLFG